jgi:hypothetical protein
VNVAKAMSGDLGEKGGSKEVGPKRWLRLTPTVSQPAKTRIVEFWIVVFASCL